MNSLATFGSLLPPSVAWRELWGPGDPVTLSAAERECATGFRDVRLQEYAAGRQCARLALAELGVEGHSLTIGRQREPLWPAGHVGSITHTARFCAAAVSTTGRLPAIGIDAEWTGQVDRSLWPVVFRASEISWLEALPAADQPGMACVLFSGKEAYFKCRFALVPEWLDFSAVELEVGSTTFRIGGSAGYTPYRFSGTYGAIRGSGLVATSVIATR